MDIGEKVISGITDSLTYAKVITLGHLLDICGCNFDRIEATAQYLGMIFIIREDLHWKLLHGIIAVNAFIINESTDSKCPFCENREMIFHWFLYCNCLEFLFLRLQRIFVDFKLYFVMLDLFMVLNIGEKIEEQKRQQLF